MKTIPVTSDANIVKIDTYVELFDKCLDQAEDICHRRWDYSASPETVARIGAALFEATIKEIHLLKAVFADCGEDDTH